MFDSYTMPMFFYQTWYFETVRQHLTTEQKEDIAKRISELTLKSPIHLDRETNYINDFPLLAPYSTNKQISGLQLCAVLTAIIREFQHTAKQKAKEV